MIQFIQSPWPWYIAGPSIAIVYTVMVLFNKSFGISSTFRTTCAMMGAGKFVNFFDFDWKKEIWNLYFILGSILGGVIASQYLSNGDALELNSVTITSLKSMGMDSFTSHIYPTEIFNLNHLFTLSGFIEMGIGGLCVGFGTRYAGGCTSGHAISGLANLEWTSVIAVIGFFIGGLCITHFILPIILTV